MNPSSSADYSRGVVITFGLAYLLGIGLGGVGAYKLMKHLCQPASTGGR